MLLGTPFSFRSKAKRQLVTKLEMAKGDGKKKRTKKEKSEDPSRTSTTTAISPIPQRVTSDINIPVRHQIQWAKMKKEYERASTSSFKAKNVKTAYRKKLDPELEEEKKLERAKRGQDPDWDVILNSTIAAPLVIVDAYNIIHQWPRLKKWMSKGELRRARDMLVQDCEELRHMKGWRIEIVFDGAGKSTTGPLGDQPGTSNTRGVEVGDLMPQKLTMSDRASKASVTDHGVRVVYSGVGSSADGYIEARCAEARKVTDGKITGSLIVASNDNMVRLAGQSAGAYCMSADRFVNELKALRMVVKFRVEAALARANGREERPAKLIGQAHPNLFRSNQFIIEDKRKKSNKNTPTKE